MEAPDHPESPGIFDIMKEKVVKFAAKIKGILGSATNILSQIQQLFTIVKYRTLTGRIVNFSEMFGHPILKAMLGILDTVIAIDARINLFTNIFSVLMVTYSMFESPSLETGLKKGLKMAYKNDELVDQMDSLLAPIAEKFHKPNSLVRANIVFCANLFWSQR